MRVDKHAFWTRTWVDSEIIVKKYHVIQFKINRIIFNVANRNISTGTVESH